MGTVIGLTFLFGFGNVLALALRLGVPTWVAPLVAPAVDLSVLGLLIGARHLALNGARTDDLRPARRLLIFASLVTLALNVSGALLAGEYGKAAFDAVGPMLLIGWAEVGPGLLRALSSVQSAQSSAFDDAASSGTWVGEPDAWGITEPAPVTTIEAGNLLERARKENARHWDEHRRPISADSLRKALNIGSVRARALIRIVRAERRGLVDAA